jgi:hypothetical protein
MPRWIGRPRRPRRGRAGGGVRPRRPTAPSSTGGDIRATRAFKTCSSATCRAPLLEALRDECWQAVVVVQSSCARWLDDLPRPPVSVLVLHDVRALVYERQASTASRPWAR